MQQAEHLEAFVAHAWQAARMPDAAEWLQKNEAKLHEFRTWSASFQWPKSK
ncbi:MAG TPA: hypothetical protein PLP04_06300 [Bryobacteraceae bacterium]|nr:hypothetical protein [Bryobacteraceae bacterium]HOL71313.1 hypothetical protein [Bryobacteraceae bacterium]HPQ14818.1 hypothetical protein [Bryobacteraceae bacterium]